MVAYSLVMYRQPIAYGRLLFNSAAHRVPCAWQNCMAASNEQYENAELWQGWPGALAFGIVKLC